MDAQRLIQRLLLADLLSAGERRYLQNEGVSVTQLQRALAAVLRRFGCYPPVSGLNPFQGAQVNLMDGCYLVRWQLDGKPATANCSQQFRCLRRLACALATAGVSLDECEIVADDNH